MICPCGCEMQKPEISSFELEAQKACPEVARMIEQDRITREMIQVLANAGTPIEKAIAFVINPAGFIWEGGR